MKRVFETVADVADYAQMVADPVVGRRLLQLQIDSGLLDPQSADLADLWLQGETARLSMSPSDDSQAAQVERDRLVARAERLSVEMATMRAQTWWAMCIAVAASVIAVVSAGLHLLLD